MYRQHRQSAGGVAAAARSNLKMEIKMEILYWDCRLSLLLLSVADCCVVAKTRPRYRREGRVRNAE
jgi:hypothetical protein